MPTKNIIIIGSSTGGPKTLNQIFSDFPLLNASLILVQHMPRFINQSVRDTIQRGTTMTVKIAGDGDMIRDGIIYIAPSETHLELKNNRMIYLTNSEKVNFVCPAIDVAMNSLKPSGNDRIIGVILTGMGKDGAQGLLHIKNIGGLTIAQDEESSIVYGMPKAAYETGCVDLVLTPEQIRQRLIQSVGIIPTIVNMK